MNGRGRPSNKTYDIVGIGASTLDTFIVVDHFPTGREVQRVIESTTDGGGPVATALATASKYGASTSMIDVIGDDLAGRRILADYEKYGVNTDVLGIEKGATSGVATILVKQDTGERAVFFEPSTADDLDWTPSVINLVDHAWIIHMNGRHRHIMARAMAYVQDVGTVFSLDGGAQRYDLDLGDVAEECHIVIVARDFGEKFTGTTDLKTAVQTMHHKGIMVAGVTDGANGSHFMWPDGTYYYCPAYSQETIVDTTGCGDSFHGAFLAKISAAMHAHCCESADVPTELLGRITHEEFEEAVHFASAVASLNTQHIGGRSGLPTHDQVDQFRITHAEATLLQELEKGRRSGEEKGWLSPEDVKKHLGV